MSNYFRTLLRLQQARDGDARTDGEEPAEPAPKRRRRGRARREAAVAIRGQAAYARLLDSLRAVDSLFTVPCVVIAGTSSRASSRPVIEGIVEQARQRGVRLFLGELVVSESERRLHRLPLPGDEGEGEASAPGDPFFLELTGTAADAAVRDWFEHATVGQDLVVVEAPPLTSSVDAALVARPGDGLVMVVEAQATAQEEFEAAVERVKASGCRFLGLAMRRSRHWLPRSLRNFFNAYPRAIRPRQVETPKRRR